MIKHFLVFLVALGSVVLIWALPLLGFKWVLWGVIALGLWEYASMAFPRLPDRIFTTLFGLAIASSMIWNDSPALHTGYFVIALFFLFVWGLFRREPVETIASRMGLIVFGGMYLGLALPYWAWIREFGIEWIMMLLLPASLTDTFAMLAGKTFGKHKLGIISPNKTLEGFIGGFFGSFTGLWLADLLFFPQTNLSLASILSIGSTIAVLVMLGDLFESLLKRSFKVKDSGHIVPDHGGMMDRLDAMVFVAPFFYYLILHKGLSL
ncbi:MAG: phosphatidate cytidylyltransferase [Deltaproteobacteria bacterium]|nr:phosphatidate cytidylyltransferase [Deltaproteobacteria bacterium]